jgi:hypothetical protein
MDSNELIPTAYVAFRAGMSDRVSPYRSAMLQRLAEWNRFLGSLQIYSVGNLSPALGARNQVGIGLSYQPAGLCSLAIQFQTRFLESIPLPIAWLKVSTLILQRILYPQYPLTLILKAPRYWAFLWQLKIYAKSSIFRDILKVKIGCPGFTFNKLVYSTHKLNTK